MLQLYEHVLGVVMMMMIMMVMMVMMMTMMINYDDDDDDNDDGDDDYDGDDYDGGDYDGDDVRIILTCFCEAIYLPTYTNHHANAYQQVYLHRDTDYQNNRTSPITMYR